jgi:hypothetical protein
MHELADVRGHLQIIGAKDGWTLNSPNGDIVARCRLGGVTQK